MREYQKIQGYGLPPPSPEKRLKRDLFEITDRQVYDMIKGKHSVPFQKLKKLFPRNKIHPRQAGFVCRGLAFLVDALIIAIISSIVYTGYSEIKSLINREKSPLSGLVQKVKRESHPGPDTRAESRTDQEKEESARKREYLKILKDKIPAEDYEKTRSLSEAEIIKKYRPLLSEDFPGIPNEGLIGKTGKSGGRKEADPAYKIIKEYIISLLYFVLFFRLKGQTPGKKLFRLRVIDLEGRPQLGWYQCFERAHGYVCSGLFLSLGFWQVLWHKSGLTMHDKIADTTVIKLAPPPRKPKKSKTR